MSLDTTAIWKRAEELAQEKIDLMYPKEQEGIRAAKFEEFRDMYYRQMAFPNATASTRGVHGKP